MTSEKRVETWTFDKACATMEINSLHSAKITVSSDYNDDVAASDLTILGLFGPEESKDSSDLGAEAKAILTGKAKEFDEELGGALVEAMTENQKAFKNGASAGSTIPTIRIVAAGKKVGSFFIFPMIVSMLLMICIHSN